MELPAGGEWLLATFNRLTQTRGQGMSGPLPITFSEIRAYCDLYGEAMTPWELDTLRQMDAAYIEENAATSEGLSDG